MAATALALGLLSGCANPPWPWGPRTDSPAKPLSSDAKPASPAKSLGSQADTESLKQVMSELQQVGALDPVAQDKLLADLKQVDPSLWPMVLQTFRAEAAYKRREEQREAERKKQEAVLLTIHENPRNKPNDKSEQQASHFELKSPAALPLTGTTLAISDTADLTAAEAPQPSSLAFVDAANRPLPSPAPPATGATTAGSTAAATDACPNLSAAVHRAPSTVQVSGGQVSPEGKPDASHSQPAVEPPPLAEQLAAIRREVSAGGVVQAGFDAPAAPLADSQWQTHLTAAIRAIESESKEGKNESDIALQARLRMLYLLAGRRDDAMRPLPAASQASQDYWSSQIYGISTWMDAEKTPDMARRAAETKRILGEALSQLGETAPLAVRNLTFCTEIYRFGAFQAVKSTEFTPSQKVLIYAEVDNLHTQSSAKGYHWAVKVGGQIFDSRGNRMADYGATSAEETYQTPRHDFFISKLYYLPRLAPGRYTLQLTIEDTLGHKVGQSSIDFTVKPQ